MVAPEQPYDERLTAPRSWWLIAALIGLAAGLLMLPLGTLPMLGGLVAGAALAAVLVSSYGSVRIRVVAGSLVAGDARIPLSALGAAHVLDREEAFAWRTHKADPRAHMLLRSYIPTALRVEVSDPDDPTPYVYLSTRSPRRLADALASSPSSEGSERYGKTAEPEESSDAAGPSTGPTA
ncbi:DUF3093 domain-containing protein [Streptomyces albidus (ex Kaewkla and Franco 2022)]|uniref:DUF3093 domain-containing protein n=1 Tax=Streptomyces albidus (ex Kaewkla and Franco 2022) TaxID=722709 RepID=UPI0015EF2551|nr:DUF3093 domain-containing protein [Streptomyces albidus (ex Kaewkla and Franco 2022)]